MKTAVVSPWINRIWQKRTIQLLVRGIVFSLFIWIGIATFRKQGLFPWKIRQPGSFAAVATTRSRGGKNYHRIAILMPYAVPDPAVVHRNHNDNQKSPSSSSSHHDNSNHRNEIASVSPYLLLFCTGAAGAADLVDFWIFHTGVLEDWPSLIRTCPDNVKFVNLGYRGLAERLLRVIDQKQQPLAMEKEELLQLATTYLQVNPYGLVEFKPALGHIFADYIDEETYTHWGYSDMDILFGDLSPNWITRDELEEFDIVTYTFGDQNRLYLRGQFTFHKNKKQSINQIWRACTYLTDMDERFAKIIHKAESYHVESAEGCYSAAVLDRTDIAVKFAVKAWTDIYRNDTAYTHGLYLSRSKDRQILYKADPNNIQVSGPRLSALSPQWWQNNKNMGRSFHIKPPKMRSQRQSQEPMQKEIGYRQLVENYQPDPDANCMYWALPKYQSKICVHADISHDDTVFWINGSLYKQRYENAVLDESVVTAPLFHFQEWKRSYRFEQISTMTPLLSSQTFVLAPEGAMPMLEAKNPVSQVESPLGLSPMKYWTGSDNSDRSQLPGNVYCIFSHVDNSTGQTKVTCSKAVNWTNEKTTTILANAPGWKSLDIEKDVTLVLVIPIPAVVAQNQRTLQNAIDHLLVTLNRWHGQPCVVVMSVSGRTKEAADLLESKLGGNKVEFASTLIAVLYETSLEVPSRKALLNMAIDAVPTRWYVSGLELLERGLSISVDAAYFAHRAAATHSRLRGSVFVVPQFGIAESSDSGLDTTENEKFLSGDVDRISDLLRARNQGKVKSLSTFEDYCDKRSIDPDKSKYSANFEAWWWLETNKLVDPNATIQTTDMDVSRRATSLEELEHGILDLATGDNYYETLMYVTDDVPLLLIDNLGPHAGIRTNEIVREIEAFGGRSCYNALRLVQLAILGYTFDVLDGAFAFSTSASRKAVLHGTSEKLEDRCQGCTVAYPNHQNVLQNVAKNELKRVAKTAILWSESLGDK
jgi:hypothetical protein